MRAIDQMRVKRAISAKELQKLLKRQGLHAVGDPPGLLLNVRDGGCSWVLRYMRYGKLRVMGLGSYRDLPSLAEARERAREQRKLLLDGIDPIEQRRSRSAELRA